MTKTVKLIDEIGGNAGQAHYALPLCLDNCSRTLKRFVFFLLLALSACSHYTVAKPGATPQQAQADSDACWYDASKAVGGEENPLIARSKAVDLAKQCLQLKGYTITTK